MVNRVVWLLALLLLIGGCGATEASIERPETTSPPSSIVVESTTSTTPETTTTTAPPVKSPPPMVEAPVLPLKSQYVVFGADGVWLLDRDRNRTQLSNSPTAVAFAVGESLVISQAPEDTAMYPMLGSGPLVIHTPEGVTEYAGAANERIRLLDVGFVDGDPVALLSVETGAGQDTEEHLVLLDVATLQRTDVGIVGGWESGVATAVLVDDVIASIDSNEGQSRVVVRSLDGQVLWRLDDAFEFDSLGSLVAGGDEILVLTPSFDDGFKAHLSAVTYEAATGQSITHTELLLDAEFGGGFCNQTDWNGTTLICSESYGEPFSVNLENGQVDRLNAPARTIPTYTVSLLAANDPSQTSEDAVRDQVPAEVAALPTELRLNLYPEYFGPTTVATPEGTWLSSTLDSAVMEGCFTGETPPPDAVCLAEYAEIVLLDSETGRIVRAYPLPSLAAHQLIVTDDAVYCIRQGDGALPASMLCRIDRDTLEAIVRVFPYDDDSDMTSGGAITLASYWIVEDPADYVLWETMTNNDGEITISGWSGTARVDPDTLELYDIEWN